MANDERDSRKTLEKEATRMPTCRVNCVLGNRCLSGCLENSNKTSHLTYHYDSIIFCVVNRVAILGDFSLNLGDFFVDQGKSEGQFFRGILRG